MVKGQNPYGFNDASKQLAMLLMDKGWQGPLDGVLPWLGASLEPAHPPHATPIGVAHLLVVGS